MSPIPRRRCSSRSVFEQVSACISTQQIGKVRIASHLNCEHSEQYHLPSGKYNFAEQNITAKQSNFAKIKSAQRSGFCLHNYFAFVELFLEVDFPFNFLFGVGCAVTCHPLALIVIVAVHHCDDNSVIGV